MNDAPAAEPVSAQLQRWLDGERPRTLATLLEIVGPGSFALLFVVLMAPAALPLPTGGATHVLEVIAMLLALQLIAGRKDVWLPQRWKQRDLAGGRSESFVARLIGWLRKLERFSRPRWRWVFRLPLLSHAFGLIVLGLTLTAVLAPPFSGLDTLPALGVVLLSLGMLAEDVLLAAAGVVIGVLGVAAALFLGDLVIDSLKKLF